MNVGHAHKVSIKSRERYWLPVDAEETNPANWISYRKITDMLAAWKSTSAL